MLWLIETRIAHLYPTTQLWDNLDREFNILVEVRANTKSSKQVYQYPANEIRTHAAIHIRCNAMCIKKKLFSSLRSDKFFIRVMLRVASNECKPWSFANHNRTFKIGQPEWSAKETDNLAILCNAHLFNASRYNINSVWDAKFNARYSSISEVSWKTGFRKHAQSTDRALSKSRLIGKPILLSPIERQTNRMS